MRRILTVGISSRAVLALRRARPLHEVNESMAQEILRGAELPCGLAVSLAETGGQHLAAEASQLLPGLPCLIEDPDDEAISEGALRAFGRDCVAYEYCSEPALLAAIASIDSAGELSTLESQILRLALGGADRTVIAEELALSMNSTKTVIRRLLAKTDETSLHGLSWQVFRAALGAREPGHPGPSAITVIEDRAQAADAISRLSAGCLEARSRQELLDLAPPLIAEAVGAPIAELYRRRADGTLALETRSGGRAGGLVLLGPRCQDFVHRARSSSDATCVGICDGQCVARWIQPDGHPWGILFLRGPDSRWITDAGDRLLRVMTSLFATAVARADAERNGARLASVVEEAEEGIVSTDPAGTILFVNRAFERASGHDRAALVGRGSEVLEARRADGAWRERWDLAPVYDGDGRVAGYRVVPREGLVRPSPEDEARAAARAERPSPEHLTVLVVEDDAMVRRTVKKTITRLGHRVFEADGLEDAVRVLGELATGGPDLLVTDVALPGAAGPEIARRLQRDHPRMRVLFVTGQPNEALETHGLSVTTANILRKPFSHAELVAAIAAVFADAGSS